MNTQLVLELLLSKAVDGIEHLNHFLEMCYMMRDPPGLLSFNYNIMTSY